MSSVILTNANGVPFERPKREDYPDVYDYWRAEYAYRDRVTAYANAEFCRGFAKVMK